MRQTFIEKFAKTYTYPYGTSFTAKTGNKSADQNSQSEAIIAQEHCERILLGKRTMRPFRLECPKTQKRVCYCDKTPLSSTSQALAYDMHLYYEGYEENFQKKMLQKLQMEQERLLLVQNKHHANTFEKFIDSLDAEEVQEQVVSLKDQAGFAKECSYCKVSIFDVQVTQSWKNEKGQSVVLCGKCNQSYISGLIDPTSDTKKVTRYMQNTVGIGMAQQLAPQNTQNAPQGGLASKVLTNIRGKNQFQKPREKQELNKCDKSVGNPNQNNENLECSSEPCNQAPESANKSLQNESDLISDDDLCATCRKPYHGDFVECDKCQKWICQPCSGLSNAQMNNDSLQFKCRACRKH